MAVARVLAKDLLASIAKVSLDKLLVIRGNSHIILVLAFGSNRQHYLNSDDSGIPPHASAGP